MKKQLVIVLSVVMKMRKQFFASLKNRSVVGLLMCFVLLISFTTKVYSQTEWTKYEGNPVLDPGPPGAWDDESIWKPSVLFDGTTYHMWYGNTTDGLWINIGYATSPDGIVWTKYDDPTTTNPPFAESDPVLNTGEPGEWDDEIIMGASVLLLDNIYYMWYTGGGVPSFYGPFSIGRATSTDGINWEKDALNPVLIPGTAGSWDGVWVMCPCVLFNGSIYHMWYAAYGDQVQIGHATSPDGVTWTKDPDNPVLTRGAYGSWDYPRVDFPSVIYDGTTYHMWYSGGVYREWRIGYATSPDGSVWTKADGQNPVLDWGEPGSWDDYSVSGCSVVFDAATYKMWYGGFDVSEEGHIGYATSPTNGIEENIIVQTNDYLHQNYPNPFNPETTIQYSLLQESKVELNIYNIKGQKVKTLVNETLESGNHTVIWNGTDNNGKSVSSGIYFYKMKTDNHEETKKMILMK